MKLVFKSFLSVSLGIILVFLSASCLITRIKERFGDGREVILTAAALSMPDGSLKNTEALTAKERPKNETPQSSTVNRELPKKTVAKILNVYREDPEIYSDYKHYPVVETTYSNGNLGYNDFFVKNTTGYDLDIGAVLENPLGFDFETGTDKIQVLIVHTHTTESYLFYDAGYYHEGFHSRTEDNEKNMNMVGESIKLGLESHGIGVVHATEIHDSPMYDGAYSRSYDTIMKYLEMYPDIKVILDIHRDSIGYGGESGKVKPTFVYNGKKAAQIMIMSGYDPDGYYDFPFWKDNLNFALKLQDTAEKMYPGMTRPLYFGEFAYNMNVNNGSLLIEVGTEVNTLEEAVYTGELLSNVMAKVLQSN